MRRRRIVVVLVCLTLGMALEGRAGSEEPSLAEHLLEILRADGTIGEEKYRELRQIAAAERRTPADVAAGSNDDIRVGWKDGFFLENPKEHFKLQLGGRIQVDAANFDEDRTVRDALGLMDDIGSGSEFRRARLFVKGQVSENVHFKAQYDFAGGDSDFKDVYLEFRDVPWANRVKLGHFKEPFSLQELTSSKYLTFMERALPNLFAPSRNTGIMFSGDSEKWEMPWSWAVGAFRETDDFGDGFGDSQYNVTGRLTAAPLYADAGAKVLHVGMAYSHKFIQNDPNEVISYVTAPEAHLGPDYLDTGAINADGVSLINPELALVLGPFSFQGEYTRTLLSVNGGPDLDFGGYYAQASYFLTGEHRSYMPSKGAFARIKPQRNALRGEGIGAWEIAARYSYLDLDDDGVSGGELADWTLALNWYLNPYTRIMLNYTRADLDNAGDTNILQTRFQLEF